MCKKLPILAIALVTLSLLTVGLGVASAQEGEGPALDVFRINYFSNANVTGAPDATVRIDNPGLFNHADLCAMIYVFDADQQLSECCGCIETPNGLRTLSVNKDLTGNPLTGVKSTRGVIKVVSAEPFEDDTQCDPSTNVDSQPNLRVWATHILNKVGTAYPITETESSDSPLGNPEPGTVGPTELDALQAQCLFIRILGSGHGTCTCGTGD